MTRVLNPLGDDGPTPRIGKRDNRPRRARQRTLPRTAIESYETDHRKEGTSLYRLEIISFFFFFLPSFLPVPLFLPFLVAPKMKVMSLDWCALTNVKRRVHRWILVVPLEDDSRVSGGALETCVHRLVSLRDARSDPCTAHTPVLPPTLVSSGSRR